MWREMIKKSFSDPAGMKVPIEWPIIESQTIETTSEGSHVRVWTDAQTSQGGIGVYLPNESWLYAQMTSTHYEWCEGSDRHQHTRIHRSNPRTNPRNTTPVSEIGIV